MKNHTVLVIGGGLAGVSAATELAEAGLSVTLLEANPYLGGRTASWSDAGMKVESGLHRYLGFYSKMPRLLKKAGLDMDQLFFWEDEIGIMLEGGKTGWFGLAPLFRPIRTLKGIFGNRHLLSFGDKARFAHFMVKGMIDTWRKPDKMDTITIEDYAIKQGLSFKLIRQLITPLSAGLFFLPPKRYSAFVFFGVFLPYLHRSLTLRVGAFKGGMTEIMMNPIADYIRSKGGTIATASPVSELLLKDGRLIGAVSEGRTYMADYTIQATSLGPAQNLLQKSFPEHPDFQNMYKLKTMPSVTIQMELSSRSMEKDRTTFAPQTCLASFAEQNHSTFPHIPGRLSVILTPPERFLNKPREEVLEIVCRDFEKIKLFIREKVTDYRMVIEPQEFYALVPGMEKYKPKQKTSIPNLYLAGDYTRQRYMATMEGAVYAGHLAAKHILKDLKKPDL